MPSTREKSHPSVTKKKRLPLEKQELTFSEVGEKCKKYI